MSIVLNKLHKLSHINMQNFHRNSKSTVNTDIKQNYVFRRKEYRIIIKTWIIFFCHF